MTFHGDCPSVVNARGELEATLDKNAYDVLAKTTLLQHTLHVAEELLKLIPRGPMTPKAIITALGHDLGKIPIYREKLYSMGDHPLIGITVLDRIKGFNEISYSKEIVSAVKEHHRSPKYLLAEKLKEADQNARRKEMAENVMVHEPEAGGQASKVAAQKPSQPVDVFGAETSEKQEIKLKELDLLWFNADEFLNEMKPYINQLYGGRFDAFSMPDGYVYFQTKVLREVSKKLAKKHGDMSVIANDMDEDYLESLKTGRIKKIAEVMPKYQDGPVSVF